MQLLAIISAKVPLSSPLLSLLGYSGVSGVTEK